MSSPALFVPTLLALAALAVAQVAPPGRFAERRLRMPPGLGPAGLSELLDLNGDGLLDVARSSGSSLTLLIQEPDGRFVQLQDAFEFPGAAQITDLAVGAIDANAVVSLVVGLAGTDEVVLSSSGDSLFAVADPSPIPPLGALRVSPVAVMIGAFGGTAADDVVIMASNGATRVLIADNLGNLVEQPNTVLPIAARGSQLAAEAADLDGDGDLDIVCAPLGMSAVLVLRNDAGAFVLANTIPGVDATRLVVGEFGGGPDPDVLAFADPMAAMAPVVLEATGALAFQSRVLPWAKAVVDAGTGDFDGDSVHDAIVLLPDGSVQIAWDLATPAPLLGPDARTDLLVGDLDADGDPDAILVGEVPPDEILLGNGKGSLIRTETLSVDTPEIVGEQIGFFVGTAPTVDPNLLVIPAGGAPVYLHNTNGVSFAPHPSPVPAAGIADATVFESARITAAGQDFVALDPSTPQSVRMFTRLPNGSFGDVTTNHWQIAGWFTHVAAGSFGTQFVAGRSDLVFATATGRLQLYRQVGGVYTLLPNAMPNTSFTQIADMIPGHFDGDALLDLCVLHGGGVTLIRGDDDAPSTNEAFDATPVSLSTSGPALFGDVADLDDDGMDDLVVSTPSAAHPLTALKSDGVGGFVDATATAWPTDVPGVTDVHVIGEGGRQTIVIALASGDVAMLERRPFGDVTWFTRGRPLPLHGAGAVEDLVVGDVDADGDEDLAVLRDGAVPQVLLNREIHLSVMNQAQMGRPVDFDFYGDPFDVQVMFIDFGPTLRYEFQPFGVLRLSGPMTLIQLATPLAGLETWRWNVPPTFLPHGFVMNVQLAWLRGAEIKLGNTHPVKFVEH